MSYIVDVEDVSFTYPEPDIRVAPPPGHIDNITMKISPSDRVLLLGQNGSGKSTLLSIIAGKRKPHKGKVTVCGKDAFDDTSLNDQVTLIGPAWPPEAYFASTVRGVTSPCRDEARRDTIAKELHLPLAAPIDKMSSGEKRRVQITFGMKTPVDVMLLDECSTDIDVAERITVLERCRRECVERGACCIYATHILDGIGEWATHIAMMEQGKLVQFMPVSEVKEPSLINFAHKWMSKAEIVAFKSEGSDARTDEELNSREVAVEGKNVNFRQILSNVSFKIYKGSRTLLIGCNGSGKTTLLNMMGSKTLFPNKNKELMVLGQPVFEDMSLNKRTVLCGDWWAVVPGGEVHVREMVPSPLSVRGERLKELLQIDLDWDVRCVSAGELKRIQLFCRLYEEKELFLLDEATADLDVDQRHMLLRWLYEENVERGVTIVYATHIFEGLRDWSTDCIVMDRTVKGIHRTFNRMVDAETIVSTLKELKAKEVWDL